MSAQHLPQRLRESSFRKYEVHLAGAVDAFPLSVVIDPTAYGLSAVTVVARIRDAKLSLKLYRWSPTRVDMQKFDTIEDDLIFAHRGDKIICGSREMIKFKSMLAPNGAAPILDEPTLNSEPIHIPNHSKELICRLVSLGLCKPLLVNGFDQEQIDHLEENWDVRISANKDGTHTIL